MKRIVLIFGLLFFSPSLARASACDGNGGVNYCGVNGQYICNDGSIDSFSVCGGAQITWHPNMDFSLFPPKSLSCEAAHSAYSYTASNCVCTEEFLPSRDQMSCVAEKKIHTPSSHERGPFVKYRSFKQFGMRPRDLYPRTSADPEN